MLLVLWFSRLTNSAVLHFVCGLLLFFFFGGGGGSLVAYLSVLVLWALMVMFLYFKEVFILEMRPIFVMYRQDRQCRWLVNCLLSKGLRLLLEE